VSHLLECGDECGIVAAVVSDFVEDSAREEVVRGDARSFPGDVRPAKPVSGLGVGGEQQDFSAVGELDREDET
jgi:hypothetical protein